MKVLVCGSSGLLGRELMKKMCNQNINCIGTYNNNYCENAVKIDFFDINQIEQQFKIINPTICINSIVERKVETCEENWNSIKKTNIDITNNIAKICRRLNIFLIHISTDYVFDGLNPPYFPESQVNPLQNYGISKLMSELKVIKHCIEYSIIRVPVLYTDDIKNINENAVTMIGKKVLDRTKQFKEDNYSIRRPNYIPDFCDFIIDIILNKKKGVFHYYNPYEKKTKYEISRMISDYLNKSINIIPINEAPNDGVERPYDTQLLDNKYNIFYYKFTPLREGIEKCFFKLRHPKITYNNSENTKDLFFLIDLDGTLIDSDYYHYNGYKKVFEKYNIIFSYDLFIEIINGSGMDVFIENMLGKNEIQNIKQKKNEYITTIEHIDFIKGAEEFIDYIYKYNINHTVVTNTSLYVVNHFKKIRPELNKLTNWITREDYKNSKPDSECYKLAVQKHFLLNQQIIGFENSICGHKALKEVTQCVYMIVDEKNKNLVEYLKNEDVYVINNFEQLQ
jgi:S-adenosylmethionine synthetase